MKRFTTRAVAAVVVGLACIGLVASPASASSSVAWDTGANASDGLILMSINMTSNQGYCEAIVDPNSLTIVNGLVDCNADGQNVAALVSTAPGSYFQFRIAYGTYFGGAWSPVSASAVTSTYPVTA